MFAAGMIRRRVVDKQGTTVLEFNVVDYNESGDAE